eukprot:2774932-Karenia_brevis.AAC.1
MSEMRVNDMSETLDVFLTRNIHDIRKCDTGIFSVMTEIELRLMLDNANGGGKDFMADGHAVWNMFLKRMLGLSFK